MRTEKATQVFEVVSRPELDSPAAVAAAAAASEALGEIWVPSRFNVVVDLPRKQQAVYNTFTGSVVVVDRQTARRCVDRKFECRVKMHPMPEGLQVLRRKGILVSKGVDELENVRAHYQASRYNSEAYYVTLLCTLGCNLRCPYCFEGETQGRPSTKTMSRETERATTAHILTSAGGKKGLSVWWFGGEPLLALGAMERISPKLIRFCEKHKIQYKAMIATNGLLLTPKIIRQLRQWKIDSVQVTVDIPRSMKQDGQGRETQEKVLDNLRLAAGKLKVHLRINLSEDSEEEFNQLYRGLIRRNLHKTLDMSMGIAHVFAPERGRVGCVTCPVGNRSYVRVVAREQAKAARLGLPFKRFFMSARLGCCSATSESSAVIGPDGLLYKCVEDVGLADRAHGSVFLPGRVKQSSLLPWLSYDWFRHPGCRKCEVLPQCAGGCPHKRLFQAKELKAEDFCDWDVRGDLNGRVRDHLRRTCQRTKL